MDKYTKNNDKVAVVGLDLSEMDDRVLEYVHKFNQSFPFEKIIFAHISKEQDLPNEILSEYPSLASPLDEGITIGLEQKIAPLFEGSATQYGIIVKHGSPLESFLKISKENDADLVILGRKKSLDGSGLLSGHIVRKSPASILFVTETFKPAIKDILLPVDFSRHSTIVYDLAQKLQSEGQAQIRFSHLYSVPLGYYKTGKSYKEFVEIMKTNASRDFSRFMEVNNINPSTTCDYLLADKGPKAQLIYHHALETGADLILIGSRGRTATSALLIGSVVEKLLQIDDEIPILVVKDKGENMGFFEALMRI
ncbi:MAG: universal stress protein [Cytophagales bacterium]|nr:universal stress protein [Cytophagales bacterium]